MARGVGDFIKDVRYDKFYVINYRYRDEIYVMCERLVKTEDVEENSVNLDIVHTFEPVVNIPFSIKRTLDVVKFKNEQDAKNVLTKLPDVVINGYEMELEVSYNAYNDFLIGV